MICFGIGCCLIGGGLKGMIDGVFHLPRNLPIREHAPVRS